MGTNAHGVYVPERVIRVCMRMRSGDSQQREQTGISIKSMIRLCACALPRLSMFVVWLGRLFLLCLRPTTLVLVAVLAAGTLLNETTPNEVQ